MKTFTALAKGFYGGGIIEEGEDFLAPDDFKAKWATEKGKKPGKEAKASLAQEKGPFADLLAKPVAAIVDDLPNRSDVEVQTLLDAERSNPAPRKGLVRTLQDEVANRAEIARAAGLQPSHPNEPEAVTDAREGNDEDALLS